MTGVIYVVIIALWIAVLIPMWLRRLDQVSESRSTERFSSSMELLGSRVMGAPVILDREEAEAAGRRYMIEKKVEIIVPTADEVLAMVAAAGGHAEPDRA